jgi:hypothetical protein
MPEYIAVPTWFGIPEEYWFIGIGVVAVIIIVVYLVYWR